MVIAKKIASRPEYLWICFYASVNSIACLLILLNHQLLGEADGVSLLGSTPVAAIGLFVIFAYIIILGPFFNAFYRFPVALLPMVQTTTRAGREIGVILFCLQLGFIVFILSEGVFIAGSTQRSSSLWSQFFVIFSCDILFLFYYAFYRGNVLYTPNFILLVISSLVRGWIGFILTLVILESIRMIRSRRLNMRLVLISVIVLIFAFPLLQLTKLAIRTSAIGASFDYEIFLGYFLSNFEFGILEEFFADAFQTVVNRIQIVSQYVVVFQDSDKFNNLYQNGYTLPFWLDGIHGVAYYRVTEQALPDNLGIQLAKQLDPTSVDLVNWNSNPGLFAWMIINPSLAPAYIIYLFVILYLTLVFAKRMRSRSPEVRDVIWFSWLAFLLPGWSGPVFLFFHSAVIFYLIHLFRRLFIAPDLPSYRPSPATTRS